MQSDKKIIYRLPYVHEPYCPVCHQRLKHLRSYSFFVRYTKDGIEQIDAFLYNCQSCELFFVDKGILQGIRNKHRVNPQVFIPGTSQDSILKKVYSKPKNPQNTQLPVKRIICNGDITKYCPQCRRLLYEARIDIPVNSKRNRTVYGKGCDTCNIIFVNHSMKNSIRSWIKNSPNRTAFFLDEKSQYDHQQIVHMKKVQKNKNAIPNPQSAEKANRIKHIESVHQQIFELYPSTTAILYADFGDEHLKRIVIVRNKKDENPSKNVYHYEQDSSREYLSAAFAPQREKAGIISGKKYTIAHIFPNKTDESQNSLDTIIPKSFIQIGKDGGNYSSERNDLDNEVIWLLVYALGTNRYELLEATYNKRKDYCFTDIWHYRQFVKHYGKPDLELEIDNHQRTSGSTFDGLRSQSFLNAYGYNVNQAEGLSDSYRHELLAEVIDLELMTQSAISNFLSWCISTSSGRYLAAESKWECDRRFVNGYRFNPSRFLIARSTKNEK